MQSQNGPPIFPLDYDGFPIPDMLGGVSTADFNLCQNLGNDVLFPLAPLQQPAHLLPNLGMDMNGLSHGRSLLASAPPQPNHRSGQHLLDQATAPVSDREPLYSVSSRSLPEMTSRESFKHEQSGSKQQHSLTTKEIVREQNRKAAARFRQRQKARTTPRPGILSCHGNLLCVLQRKEAWKVANPTCMRHCCEADNSLPNFAVCLQDKLKEYEKQIQDLTAKLSAAEKEKCTYELKCGEMEKVRPVTSHNSCLVNACGPKISAAVCCIVFVKP